LPNQYSSTNVILTQNIGGIVLMADSNSGSNKSSTGSSDSLANSPWGRLKEVLGDKELADLFKGVGGGEGSTPPSGSGSPSSGSPFTGFGDPNAPGSPLTGGVNPWAPLKSGGSKDPLTGGGSGDPLTGGGNTSQIPDGLKLRGEIDKLVNSKLKSELGEDVLNSSFGGGTGGGNPFAGDSGSGNPFAGGTGGGNPFGGGTGGGNPFAGGTGGGNPFGDDSGGGNPFGGGTGGGNPFAGDSFSSK
jgi:hypothetical protein